MPPNQYKTSDKKREYQRNWRKNNPEKVALWRYNNRKYHGLWNLKIRNDAMQILGGKCVVCGIDDTRCLQIDHINGGGNRELRLIHGTGLYRKILMGAQGYQVLCANHNWIKRFENGEHRALPAEKEKAKNNSGADDPPGSRCKQPL